VLLTFQKPPIIVRIVETPKGPLNELARVILRALGVTGVFTLVAILLGLIFAVLLIWLRSRSA